MKTAKDFQEREISAVVMLSGYVRVYVSARPTRDAVADRLRAMGFTVVQLDIGGYVFITNLINFDSGAIAKEIHSWNDDTEWLNNVKRTSEPSPVDRAQLDNAARWWRSGLSDNNKELVLRLLRSGESGAAVSILKTAYGLGSIVVRAVVIHACSVLAGETEPDTPEMTQDEWSASADAHGKECWERVPYKMRHLADLLMTVGRASLAADLVWRGTFLDESDARDAVEWRYKSSRGRKSVVLDPQELSTVLAALRYWQDHRRGGVPWLRGRTKIATSDGETALMSYGEIDALCERISGG